MEYASVLRETEAEIEVQKSRFIACLKRVATEKEARDFIEARRALHPKARHHVTAFILGAEEVMRSSDDGEPAGTGGSPTLEALRAAGLGDVVAVVTRYFGGTLLGAGGLTRAYRAATAEAVSQAPLVKRALRLEVTAQVAYDLAPLIEAKLRASGHFLRADYTEQVTIVALSTPQDLTELTEYFAEVSGGSATVTRGELCYYDIVD